MRKGTIKKIMPLTEGENFRKIGMVLLMDADAGRDKQDLVYIEVKNSAIPYAQKLKEGSKVILSYGDDVSSTELTVFHMVISSYFSEKTGLYYNNVICSKITICKS